MTTKLTDEQIAAKLAWLGARYFADGVEATIEGLNDHGTDVEIRCEASPATVEAHAALLSEIVASRSSPASVERHPDDKESNRNTNQHNNEE